MKTKKNEVWQGWVESMLKVLLRDYLTFRTLDDLEALVYEIREETK